MSLAEFRKSTAVSRKSSDASGSQKIDEDDPSRIWEDLPKKYRVKNRGAYIRRHNDFKIASNYRKFMLLMWKNYIVMKRRWKVSLLQFCAPIFLITMIVIYHTRHPSPGYSIREYRPFRIDKLPAKTFNDCDTIYFWPKIPMVDLFIDNIRHCSTVKSANRTFRFEYLELTKNATPTPADLCALIEFSNETKTKNNSGTYGMLPNYIKYKIRFPAVYNPENRTSSTNIGNMWDTSFTHPSLLVDGARELNSSSGGHPGYYENGFLFIQHVTAMEFIKMIMMQEGEKYEKPISEMKQEIETFLDKISVRLRRFPFPSHESDDVTHRLYNIIPSCLIAGFGVSSLIMVYSSVREREMGIRTLLRLYGITGHFHKYSFILYNWLFLSLSGILITLILSTKWTTSLSGVYLLNQKFLSEMFLVLLICYIFNIVCSATLFSHIFNNETTACISVILLTTLTYFPYLYIKQKFSLLTTYEWFISSLMPHTALGIGCLIIATLQAKADRSGWDNIYGETNGIGFVYLFLIFTGIFYLLMALYIARVFPEKGIQKLPWNFLFTSWFWNNQPPPTGQISHDLSHEKAFEEQHFEYFENDTDTKKRKELCVENLSKYVGFKRILHKVNFVCYQDYVTALLGEQGSGKSMLLTILNGSTMPSKGTVYLSRKDLFKNAIMGRAFIGYCPSENLLFPDLTVDETLQLFTDLKGVMSRIEAYEEVERVLKITTLMDCRDVCVSDLTASSQRMLMVATAFCGGSRVVLLDDPTIKLNAIQQRLLWDYVSTEKKHRTVVVAMDSLHEGDKVIDKLVILNKGQVTSRGTTDHLQQTFGGGYNLEIDALTFYDEEEIDDLVTRRITGSFLTKKSWNGRHFIYYLPPSQTAYFPGLLEELERYHLSYGIGKVRIRALSLEELYQKLKRMLIHDQEVGAEHEGLVSTIGRLAKRKMTDNYGSNILYSANPEMHPGDRTTQLWGEFRLMFLKNMKFTWRHRAVFVLSTVVPVLLLMLVHIITLRLEFDEASISHLLDINNTKYADPFVTTDMAEASNEGVFLRESVEKFLRQKGIKQHDLNYEQSISQVILEEYATVRNEIDMSRLGIEIFQSRENMEKPDDDDGGPKYGRKIKVKVGLTGYFNNQQLHTPAVSLSLLHNIMLHHIQAYVKRKQIIKNYNITDYELEVTNHPLNYQPADIVKHSEVLMGPGYLFGVFTSFAYAFHFPFYIVMHVREEDFRHLQLIFGANMWIFWGANYLWNLVHFSIVAGCHLAFLAIAGIPGFSHASWSILSLIWRMASLLEVYGLCCINLIGCFASWNFKTAGKGYSKLLMLFMGIGPLAMVALIPMREIENPWAFAVAHNLFLLLPGYSFGTGMYYILANEAHNTECGKIHKYVTEGCKEDDNITAFTEFTREESIIASCCYNKRSTFAFIAYGIGRNITTLIFITIVCILLKAFSYTKRMRKWQKQILDKRVRRWKPMMMGEREVMDYDVLAETAKIFRRVSQEDDDELTVRNLTLETKSYVKLDNICVDVKCGECFVLLGTSFSGKTSLLKTLCGYPRIMPTYGDVEFQGLSLLKDYDKYLSTLSYCPDKNPFLGQLTGEETLELLGALRKLSPRYIRDFIGRVASKFDCLVEMEKQTERYNYNLAKKICFAASLMGHFKILLLDSPTHGLDSRSAQIVIENVQQLMREGRIIVWASDRIEHTDEICSKMSIIVNGHLRCFGTLQHLRSLYETGFTVIVRFKLDKDFVFFTSKKNIWMENEIREDEIDEETGLPVGASKYEERKENLVQVLRGEIDVEQALVDLTPWEQDLCAFIAFFERSIEGAILVDKQPGFVHYHVKDKSCSWYQIFTRMEEAKSISTIDTYYICQTNLEQVYLNFSRGQKAQTLE